MSQSTRPATRIEIKYGVTTDFPDLGLHSAAVTNNVGLAHFALTHGQPENSVLHGLLPLHAASSGGSEEIIKMLLERGADVNAPRLPRRFSTDKKSSPSIGVSGSGPLHFAAAAGHLQVVKLLLSNGARHDMRDKHGLTAEDLAVQGGHDEVVATLRAWATLRASLSRRDDQDSPSIQEDDHEDDTLGGMPPLRSKPGLVGVGTGAKKPGLGVKRSLDFVRGRRASSSASSSSGPAQMGFDQPSLRHTPSKLSLTPSTTSSFGPLDSALETTSPIDPIPRRLSTDAPLHPLPSHLTEPKSRRPSLPAILEKAAHSIAHPHRSNSTHRHPPSQPPLTSLARAPTFTSLDDSDSGSVSSARRFTGHSALGKLFHRNHRSSRNASRSPSPTSASPSPPSRLTHLPVFDEDVDKVIEAMQRQSFGGADSSRGDSSRGGSLDLPHRISSVFGLDDEESTENRTGQRPPPPSAPATKTSFFPPTPALKHRTSSASSTTSSHYVLAPQGRSYTNGSALHSPAESPELSEHEGPVGERAFYRPRKGSEVVSPSPLASEWSVRDGIPVRRQSSRRSRRSAGGESESALPPMNEETTPDRTSVSGSYDSEDDYEDGSASERYRSSASVSTRPDQTPYPPSSPGSSYQHPSTLRPSLSASPSKTSFANSYTTSSTDRPPPSMSSNASSLRKVASANLRRGEGSRYDAQDPYAPSGSIYGTDAPPYMFRTASLDDDDAADSHERWASQGHDDRASSSSRPRNDANGNGTAGPGRRRGASITSSVSSAFSTSPQTSPALGPLRTSSQPPAITVSDTSARTGRVRGVSVSSVTTSASGRAEGPGSANGTSYSAASLLSSGAPSTSSSGTPAFAPVPEHSLTPSTPVSPFSTSYSHSPVSVNSSGSGQSMPRRVSSRAEAHDLVREAERSILDRPASSESALSLSAQLAAYGEKLALEREFAAQERETAKGKGRERARTEEVKALRVGDGESRRRSRSRGDESHKSSGSTDGGGGRSAKSKQVVLGSQPGSIRDRPRDGSSTAVSQKTGFAKHVQDRSSNSRVRAGPPVPLFTVEAPPSQRSSIPNVNQIYSDRAEAMRKKAIAVTSAISTSPIVSPSSSLGSHQNTPRRASHPNPDGDRQLWIISGHGSGATGLTRTPPTPTTDFVADPINTPTSRAGKPRQSSLDTITSGGKGSYHAQTYSRSPLAPPPPPSSISPSESISNRGGGRSSSTPASALPSARLVPPVNTTSRLPPLASPPSSSFTSSPSSSPAFNTGGPRRGSSPKPVVPTSAPATFEVVKRSGEGGEVKADLIGLGLGMKPQEEQQPSGGGLGGGKNTPSSAPARKGSVGWGAKIFGRRG